MDDPKRKKISAEEFVRMVYAGELSKTLTKNEADMPVTWLEVEGDVLLTEEIKLPLFLVDCLFNGKFTASNVHFLKEVDFTFSEFIDSFSVEGAYFSDFMGDDMCFNEGFFAAGAVFKLANFSGSTFHAVCDLENVKFHSLSNFSRVSFYGDLKLCDVSFEDIMLTDEKLAKTIFYAKQKIYIPYSCIL